MTGQKDVRTLSEHRDPAAPEIQMISGKLVIISIIALAIAAAVFGWWFRYSATNHAARFWGPEASTLIRDAPLVGAFHLQPVETPTGHSGQIVAISGRSWKVAEQADVSKVPGILHLRNALIEDDKYDWSAHGVPTNAEWRYGLSFRRQPDDDPLMLYFTADFKNMCVQHPGDNGDQLLHHLACQPILSDGLAQMFGEWEQKIPDFEPAKSLTIER